MKPTQSDSASHDGVAADPKDAALEYHRERPDGTYLTNDQGVGIPHTDDSLKAGPRGPTLLEDFHFREKLTRFDHERIPERVVHARGSGAHGYFQVYASQAKWTKAGFLQDPAKKTPVFVRFSTVAGSRGSADTVRDVRGFAVKFYTDEGNFDLVGNNIPVFFIQDGIKFPDVVHAVKPEPHHEMPQAASAHDSFWDFVSLVPETAHMVMWAMSDRGIPRSYRMMEGFGVHTFRLINDAGKSHLVKFHWKPKLGVHGLVWDEAQKIAGKDPDFHRRDLWEAIDSGSFPEYELGLQIVDEADALKFGFDLLDATKLIPEELVPVHIVGKMVLNRNPDNFFAETEQVAFCVSHVVPGIDFTDDPLMQARLFSYLDTQLTRLGGPNFAELPINRPVAPVHNHQQDGFSRHTIQTGRANYHPNSLGGGCPFLALGSKPGFTHYPEPLEGSVNRTRSATFQDHFSQARLFLHSLTEPERLHLVEALKFELGKVETPAIRERVLGLLSNIETELAETVSTALGVSVPARPKADPASSGPGGAAKTGAAKNASPTASLESSPALSMNRGPGPIATRKVAALVSDGFDAAQLSAVRSALEAEGAILEVIGHSLGEVTSNPKGAVAVDKALPTVASVLYDAVFVVGGSTTEGWADDDDAVQFLQDAYRHKKPIAASGEGVGVLQAVGVLGGADPKATAPSESHGVVAQASGSSWSELGAAFVAAIAAHRHWDRQPKTKHAQPKK